MNETIEKFEEVLDKMLDEPDQWPDSASFLSMNTVLKENILTPKRIEIMKHIKENEVNSMSDLAEQLDRSVNNVSSDVKVLKKYSLLEVEADGRKKVPKLSSDHLFVLF